jgi:hypothetical protein
MGMSGQTYAISIQFHRVATIFKTPPINWLLALFSSSGVDVAPDVIGDNVTRIVAQLEAWRGGSQNQRDAAS